MDDITFVEKNTTQRRISIDTTDINIKAVDIKSKEMLKNLLDGHVGWIMINMGIWMIDKTSYQPQMLVYLYNPEKSDPSKIELNTAWWVLRVELGAGDTSFLGDIEFEVINDRMTKITKRPAANKRMFKGR